MRINPFLPLSFFVISILLSTIACNHDTILEDDTFIPGDTTVVDPGDTTVIDPSDTTNNGTPCDPDVIYFSQQILPILRSNCAMSGCHDAITEEDGVNLTSYQKIIETADVRAFDLNGSDLYEVLTDDDVEDRMPPSPNIPLTSTQVQLIADWILQGAQDLECDPNPVGCDTENVSYAAFVKPVIQNNCQGCHSGGAPSGGVNLSTYEGIKGVANDGRLYKVTSWQPGSVRMPLNGNQLPACTIDKIKSWIDNGAPNN